MTLDSQERRATKPQDGLLTLREAAAFLGLRPRTVVAYVQRGELIGCSIRRRWRFRQADLERFFDQTPARWDFYREPAPRERALAKLMAKLQSRRMNGKPCA